MAIARELVELHGGTIKARSDGDGHGQHVQVDLPSVVGRRARRHRAARRSAGRADDGDSIGSAPRTSHLVVDDEPDARDLIEMALSQYGAIVTTRRRARRRR